MAYREPPATEKAFVDRCTSFVLEILEDLSSRSVRAQGPVSTMWACVVEALDPQERGVGVGGWSSFDDDEMDAVGR